MVLSLKGAVRFIFNVLLVQIVIGILMLIWKGMPEGKELFMFIFSLTIPLLFIEIICSADRWSKKSWSKDYVEFMAILRPRFIINLYKKDPSEPDGEALMTTSIAMHRFVAVCMSGGGIPITVFTFFTITSENVPYFMFSFMAFVIIFWLYAAQYYRKAEKLEKQHSSN